MEKNKILEQLILIGFTKNSTHEMSSIFSTFPFLPWALGASYSTKYLLGKIK